MIIAITRMKIKKERIIAIYLQFFDVSLHLSFLGLQMLGPMAKCRSNGKGDGPRVEDGARIGQPNLELRMPLMATFNFTVASPRPLTMAAASGS